MLQNSQNCVKEIKKFHKKNLFVCLFVFRINTGSLVRSLIQSHKSRGNYRDALEMMDFSSVLEFAREMLHSFPVVQSLSDLEFLVHGLSFSRSRQSRFLTQARGLSDRSGYLRSRQREQLCPTYLLRSGVSFSC